MKNKRDIGKQTAYFGLLHKGLDMEEIITLSGLERLRESVAYGNLDRSIKKKMIKIIDRLSKDTLKHIKIFKHLINKYGQY